MCASVSGQIPSFRARILDISQGGARLLVTPSLKVGDLLRIRSGGWRATGLYHSHPGRQMGRGVSL